MSELPLVERKKYLQRRATLNRPLGEREKGNERDRKKKNDLE